MVEINAIARKAYSMASGKHQVRLYVGRKVIHIIEYYSSDAFTKRKVYCAYLHKELAKHAHEAESFVVELVPRDHYF